jgi:hypothetical protein
VYDACTSRYTHRTFDPRRAAYVARSTWVLSTETADLFVVLVRSNASTLTDSGRRADPVWNRKIHRRS